MSDKSIRSAELLVTKILASPDLKDELKTKPDEVLKRIQAEVEQQLPRVSPPDGITSNVIWLTVIIAFSLVLLGTAYVLGTSITSKLEQGAEYATKSETVVMMFTTAVGFLAGLLSPSPLKR